MSLIPCVNNKHLVALHRAGLHSVALFRRCGSPRVDGQVDVNFPVPPPASRAALDRLAARDADLGRVEAVAGPLPWRQRPPGFPGLLQAIVGQQISSQAASAIWRRLHATAGALHPTGLSALPDAALREAGLSRPKMAHARALAEAFAEGRLDAAMLQAMSDQEAVAAITAIRGLGSWSAEIYLLFALGRDDVFPAGDLALASATADLKRLATRPGAIALRAMAGPWRPWRGLAARLLWHYWRHVTGRPALDDLPLG
jgi:DNA-3-methyladenine glycosylase II